MNHIKLAGEEHMHITNLIKPTIYPTIIPQILDKGNDAINIFKNHIGLLALFK